MPSKFNHHPDGFITISDGVDTLQITLAEFLTYEPAYTLPSPYVGRQYIPAVKHVYYKADGSAVGASLPYTAGDGYIADLATYINEHDNPTKTLSEAKADKILALNSLAQTKKQGGINLFSTVMPTFGLNAQAIISYQLATATPVGFYLRDVNDVNVPLTLAQLLTYNDGIVELHQLCDVNRDDLEDDINALASVGAVDAFDITTGWPTIPYTP